MKRFFSIGLTILLCTLVSVSALSEAKPADELFPETVPATIPDRDLLLGAQVIAAREMAVKAPATGELEAFSVRAGDAVKAGDELFAVEPKKVYADMDGIIADVYAKEGDIADAAVTRYGAVLFIEWADRYEVVCDTQTGYNSVENRDLRVGTKVYLRSANERYFAEGWITKLNGSAFTVAVKGGNLVFTQDVKVYRERSYGSRSLLARSSLSIVPPYGVSASGTIISMRVKPGDVVKAGDLLFTYVPDALEPGRRGGEDATLVKAEDDWIIGAIHVTQGASVQKAQALCTVYPAGQYQLLAYVDEGDIASLRTGETMIATFEELGLEPVMATVASISPLGGDGETSKYMVYFDFIAPAGVMLGMHATVR